MKRPGILVAMPEPLPRNRVGAWFGANAVLGASISLTLFFTTWAASGFPGPLAESLAFIAMMTVWGGVVSIGWSGPLYYFSRYMARSEAVDGPIVDLGLIASAIHTANKSWYTWTSRVHVRADAPGWLVDVEGIQVRLHVPSGSLAERRLGRLEASSNR